MNIPRIVRMYLAPAFLILLAACLTGLYKNRAEGFDYIACIAFFAIALAAIEGGTIVGLLAALVVFFANISFLVMDTFLSGAAFVLTAENGWWMGISVVAALGLGLVGDRLKLLDTLFVKYSSEIGELVSTGSLSRFATAARFAQDLQYEVSRSKRSKSVFILLYVKLVDLPDITMRFGKEGLVKVMAQVGNAILHLTRDTDKKARIDDSTYGIILPETPRENLAVVLRKLDSELKGVKVEHKGELVRYTPMVVYGSSAFPSDGDNDIALVNKARETLPKVQEDKCDFIKKT